MLLMRGGVLQGNLVDCCLWLLQSHRTGSTPMLLMRGGCSVSDAVKRKFREAVTLRNEREEEREVSM
jgi:hypothetical protein